MFTVLRFNCLAFDIVKVFFKVKNMVGGPVVIQASISNGPPLTFKDRKSVALGPCEV